MEKADQNTRGRVIFRTETGSLYEVDYDLKSWMRVKEPEVEGEFPLRTPAGTFDSISDIEVGKPVTIIAEPINPNATFRCITTSPVATILSTSEHAVD